jgi:hypothetical protein
VLESPRQKILYILSSPHSGSTVFGMALAGHPDVVFGGELFEIPDPAWTEGRVCSCGQSLDACPFWSGVRSKYTPPSAPPGGRVHKWGWRDFPRVAWSLHRPHGPALAYARDVQDLAGSIAEVSGRSVVVDTSKDGTRALAYLLAPRPNLEVYYLHLTRDPQSVVRSRIQREVRTSTQGRHGRTPTLRYSALWAAANLSFTLIFAPRSGAYLRIRYEDFLRDPESTLREVGSFLGVDLSPVTERILQGGTFPPGHVIAGNRLRLGGGVQVRRDSGVGDPALAEKQGGVFRWVSGWAARLYGYR